MPASTPPLTIHDIVTAINAGTATAEHAAALELIALDWHNERQALKGGLRILAELAESTLHPKEMMQNNERCKN